VNGLTLAVCEGLPLGDLDELVGNGQELGNKSPSLSNLSLERVSEDRPATVEERRREKEEDNVQALVGERSMSMSKELIGEVEYLTGLAIGFGDDGHL